jgi:hypothetical protein
MRTNLIQEEIEKLNFLLAIVCSYFIKWLSFLDTHVQTAIGNFVFATSESKKMVVNEMAQLRPTRDQTS